MSKKIRNTVVVLMAPVLLYLFFLALRPGSFGKASTLYIIITQSFITCIVAWGMQPLVSMGQFDLALGAEMVLDCILAALFCAKLGFIGILLGCLTGALLCGVIKGALYKIMRIPTMILTIALVYLLGAAGGLITNSKALTIPSAYTVLGRAPGNIIVFAVAGIIMYLLVNASRYGAHVKAVAGSPSIARSNGIHVESTMIRSLLLSSLFAGVAAVIQLSHGSGVTPSVGLDSIKNIMEPIMSVFIGFVMAKYINVVFSIFVGAVLMSIVSNGITALNWSSSIYNVVVGIILILIMAYMNVAELMVRRREEKRGAMANMRDYQSRIVDEREHAI